MDKSTKIFGVRAVIEAIDSGKTGLYVNGDAKSVKVIKQSKTGKVVVIIATNNGKAETFELNNTPNYLNK